MLEVLHHQHHQYRYYRKVLTTRKLTHGASGLSIQVYANSVLVAPTTIARGVDGWSCLTGTSLSTIVLRDLHLNSLVLLTEFALSINALTSNSTISAIDSNIAARIQLALNDSQETEVVVNRLITLDDQPYLESR